MKLKDLVAQALTSEPIAFKALVVKLQKKLGAGWGTEPQSIAHLIKCVHFDLVEMKAVCTWDTFGNSYFTKP